MNFTYKTILLESTNSDIKVLTLNYPKKLNILSQVFFDEFDTCIENLRNEKSIKSLIIKGNEKVFSAGGDLKEMLSTNYEDSYQMCIRTQNSFKSLINLDFPVIAMLDGLVYGGGFELALHCDIRFCTPETIFKLPEVDLGLIPGAGGISIFSKTFSLSDVAYYLYSGGQIPVEEVYRKGLIQEVINKNNIYDFSVNFAKKICNKSQESISTIKRILYSNLFSSLDQCLEMEAKEFSSVLQRIGKKKITEFFETK
ncbi:enoyl-CoA hydratase/isomerase family protein [Bacteroidales bacterium OttesenSCG-928-I21]|nr:enoyl-CoA hydratase/isomerase family protein [Bacteroidales bacterium OttesenSCG-928-I21]